MYGVAGMLSTAGTDLDIGDKCIRHIAPGVLYMAGTFSYIAGAIRNPVKFTEATANSNT